MSLKPNQRRHEFDEITMGWGSDDVVDLTARCELMVEYYRCLGGYTAAELKIANAMERRLRELGGTMPVAKNTAKADGVRDRRKTGDLLQHGSRHRR